MGLKLTVLSFISNLGMLAILNLGNKGEANADATPDATPATEEKTFTQDHVNKILADTKRQLVEKYEAQPGRIAELQEQLSKYKQAEEQKQQSKLEEQKEYEKLKETWTSKENEYKTMIEQKKNEITDMKVSSTLTNAIIEANAHADTIQLIKSNAMLNDKGEVVIKGKDANGFETELSVKEGVEQFLKDRPHLVKVAGGGGSGTVPSNSGGGGVANSNDPMALANELQIAMQAGDRKKINEIKAQIGARNAQRAKENV